MDQPNIYTERLLLRPFTLHDAADVQRFAGAVEVAGTTGNIPHPYLDGMAEQWISGHAAQFDQGSNVIHAIVIQATGQFCGAISLEVTKRHRRAELGYWIGTPFWNQGYCTEAGAAMLEYAFDNMALRRVTSSHLLRNPASGRVMVKLGMTREGVLRQHVIKGNTSEDLVVFGLLAEEWSRKRDG